MTSLLKKTPQTPALLSVEEFMLAYNATIPPTYPRVSEELLKKFKSEHPLFFKHGNKWSLDEHRKKVIDWFQHLSAQ